MPPPDKFEALSPALRFNPQWIPDPVPWWIFEVLGESQRVAVAKIQLQLVRDTLAAQMAAVEKIQGAIGQEQR